MDPAKFDQWNEIKKKLHFSRNPVFCNPREIWWCYLGMNIGTEQNGKHDIFERPVLVIQVFSKETCRIIPLTSGIRNDKHHISIHYNNEMGSLILAQTRSISAKRLSRRMCWLEENQFKSVIRKLKLSIQVETPTTVESDGSFSGPEGMVN